MAIGREKNIGNGRLGRTETDNPQRWTDNYFLWMKELIWQNLKNGVKYFVVGKR